MRRWDSLQRGETNQNPLTEGQVENILNDLGIDIEGETDSHYLIFCPFHSNHHTPAATVSITTGYMYCWGGSCSVRMRLVDVIKEIRGWDTMRSLRFIEKNATESKPIDQVLEEIYATDNELPTFPEETLAKMQEFYRDSKEVQEYVASRKINSQTAEYFGLGYDPHRKMVCTPMRSTDKKLVGVIGRSIVEKRFKNSTNLPTKKSLFNIQNAKRAGSESVVIVESNFDAIRVHQSGYPSVVATLGGTFSKYHLTQINRSFNRVILGVDADEAGQTFASRIASQVRKVGCSVYQARHSEGELFPHDAKDFGDCSDKEIAWMIRNASLFVN